PEGAPEPWEMLFCTAMSWHALRLIGVAVEGWPVKFEEEDPDDLLDRDNAFYENAGWALDDEDRDLFRRLPSAK
ncbi:MAG: hypothetical protein ABIR39_13735, partial [Nocardioides sp.]|uniref:hypothetical protein n=1 Tax=Nocardioides sp. TaxID=35761 RepID=UPI0032631C40